MRNQIKQLLFRLAEHYPIREAQLEAYVKDYPEIIFNHCYYKGHKYNFDKVYYYIIENHAKGYPSLPQLKDYVASGIEREYFETSKDGELVVVTLPNGYTYSFEFNSFGNGYSSAISKLKKEYGNISVKHYPKGTVIIGGQVFLPE